MSRRVDPNVSIYYGVKNNLYLAYLGLDIFFSSRYTQYVNSDPEI